MPSNFGNLLKSARLKSGFKSLASVIDHLEENFDCPKGCISKSLLNLYERGEIKTIKPETLKLLADLYEIDYSLLAATWFQERYKITSVPKNIFNSSKVELFSQEKTIKIISLDEFAMRQSKLPKGTQIGVAAVNFLDDNIMFEVVSKNIDCGVTYTYLLPEDKLLKYQVFISRVENTYPTLKGKIDGKKAHFIPKPKLDFPMNYVIYLYPNGTIEGYVGLLYSTKVEFMQEADIELTWHLFDGFRWAISVAKDRNLKAELNKLQQKVMPHYFNTREKKLDSFLS